MYNIVKRTSILLIKVTRSLTNIFSDSLIFHRVRSHVSIQNKFFQASGSSISHRIRQWKLNLSRDSLISHQIRLHFLQFSNTTSALISHRIRLQPLCHQLPDFALDSFIKLHLSATHWLSVRFVLVNDNPGGYLNSHQLRPYTYYTATVFPRNTFALPETRNNIIKSKL